ncbi:MAG: isoleucine--tRNA ligase [Planctomycetota bacterium]|nr:MAG: isoleucine--tRNA ligase [Planctomycetota bacterium]
MDYRPSVRVMKTKFPQRANLTRNEPAMRKRWDEMKLYGEIQKNRKNADLFVLHDGPPYANGYVHMGTGLNKILKDVVVKYKTMRGFRAPYIPGWDCHGLPIEFKVTRETEGIENLSALEIRKLCLDYAMKFVDIQREQFMSLLCFGDWHKPYLTVHSSYEAAVIETFGKLVEAGAVYRQLKPIHWCMSCRTALAAAELEYQTLPSDSIYVRMEVDGHVKAAFGLPEDTPNVYALIWTTTPWTLPANTGIMVGEKVEYSCIKAKRADGETEYFILATDLVREVMAVGGVGEFEQVKIVTGDKLVRLTYKHPFVERTCKLVPSPYIKLDTGTGLVHTAPGHGSEDFYVGTSQGLELVSPLDDGGCFTDEFEMMKGVNVFDANPKINELLEKEGYMFQHGSMEHEYPCCWRCKEPVIFRATVQWFIKVDHPLPARPENPEGKSLRAQSLIAVQPEFTEWIPEHGRASMMTMLKERPDWCISRQRTWGVPIPALHCKKCGEATLNKELCDRVQQLFAEHGADEWYRRTASEIAPEGFACKCGSTEFEKEPDIFDVWFESGNSWNAVCRERDEIKDQFPVDLYLEGSDQYRGWFQTSLLPAVASTGSAPYKTVLTHGFIVDEDREKLSKTKKDKKEYGKARGKKLTAEEEKLKTLFANAEDCAKNFGADILRIWTTSVDYREDIRLSNEIMERRQQAYRKIRNTIRALLGNLNDFDPKKNRVEYKDMNGVDRWALMRMEEIRAEVTDAYEKYEFYRAFNVLNNFCIVDLSSFYIDVTRDRLYCDGEDWPGRRSAQTAYYEIAKTMVKLFAPILAYTCEEAWQYIPGAPDEAKSVHLADWPVENEKIKENEYIQHFFKGWRKFFEYVRPVIMISLEASRDKKIIASNLEGKVRFTFSKEGMQAYKMEEIVWFLERERNKLSEYIVCSEVLFSEVGSRSNDAPIERITHVSIEKSEYPKCARCWNLRPSVGKDEKYDDLCERCVKVMNELNG